MTFRTVHNLAVMHSLECAHAVRALAVSLPEQHLVVALQSGHLEIYALKASELRKLVVERLQAYGFC